MKICHYKTSNGPLSQLRLGILIDSQHVIDPHHIFSLSLKKLNYYQPEQRALKHYPTTLSKFLKLSLAPLEDLTTILELYEYYIDSEELKIKIKDTDLGKPLDQIETYRDFFVHEAHVKKGFEKRGEEIPEPWYEMPVYYKGATAGFIGPHDEILWPSYSEKLDYELELGCIISKDCHSIKENKAMSHILGLTILNDISARDIQKKEMMVRLGPAKGKDFCSVIGPVIVTMDEFNFQEPNLLMTAKVNNQLWSKGYSGMGRYTFAQMIAHASKDEWVLAGDFLGSGTVGTGCGLELDKWIKPGDLIELEVERIGKLINRVGHPIKKT